MRLAQARFDGATADFEAMLAVARGTGAGAAERAALAGLCDALFFAQRADDMSARARELLDVATRAGADADVEEARARIGQALVCEGRLFEAAPLLDEVLVRARHRGLRVALKLALMYRGFVHYWQTEYQATEARSAEAAAAAAAGDIGDGFYALAARMFCGLSRVHLGRISEALEDFRDAKAFAERNDDRYWLPRIVSHLGWVHREMGALERAREWDTKALALARERGWGPEPEALLNLCVDDVRQGRVEEAAALLAELEARAAQSSWMRWISDLRLAVAAAEHWMARGDCDRADESAQRLARRRRPPRLAGLPVHRRARARERRAGAGRGARGGARAAGRHARRAEADTCPARGVEVRPRARGSLPAAGRLRRRAVGARDRRRGDRDDRRRHARTRAAREPSSAWRRCARCSRAASQSSAAEAAGAGRSVRGSGPRGP